MAGDTSIEKRCTISTQRLMTTLRYFILSANSGQHFVLRKDFRLNLGYSLACGAVVLLERVT